MERFLADGKLQPGRVASGLDPSQRSDLMAWVPAADAQPPALRALLSALDRLVLALGRASGPSLSSMSWMESPQSSRIRQYSPLLQVHRAAPAARRLELSVRAILVLDVPIALRDNVREHAVPA